jgi:hypothetical protein
MSIPSWVKPGETAIETGYQTGPVMVAYSDEILSVSATSATVHYIISGDETNVFNYTFAPDTAGAWGYQFWVDPTNPTGSIVGPDGETLSILETGTFDNLNATELAASGPDAVIHVIYQTSTGLILEESETFPTFTNIVNLDSLSSPATTVVTPTAPTPLPANSGNTDEWILSNGQWQASAEPGSAPSGLQVAGVGDFIRGATDGILWYDPNTGDASEWKISDAGWAGTIDLGAHPGSYLIAGVGDFTGNGTDDVLWFDSSTGQTDIWELSNGQWAASVSPGTHPTGYAVAGIGDFTGNGTDGILWYNASTGDTDEWQLANGKWSASVDLGSHPGSGWQIAAVGDFFDNGRDDVLWTNSSSGQVQTDIWELGSKGQWIASVSPGSHPAGYQVAGVGDFTGNGTDGILWYDPSTGDTDEWQLSNGKWAASVDLGSHPGSGWQIAGVGDFTGNGTSDILWHQS